MAAYLDANILIAIIEGRPLSTAQHDLLARLVDGRLVGATSELSLAECLVRPYRERDATVVAAYLEYLSGRPEISVLPITRNVLLRAARIRATSRLKLPDAIHLATAFEAGCPKFITNDRDFRAGTEALEVVIWDEME